jgi:GNAT superfamily N-acetyltransferase
MSGTLVRQAGQADAAALHTVADATFRLACPPGTLEHDMAEFVRTHLSEERMSEYLSDPRRDLFLAEAEGEPAGYTMLVYGEPQDAEAAAAITTRPTVELSKCYVVTGHHGSGVASALLAATIDAARSRGAAGIWLGVNQHNPRANAFYDKSGFRIVGTKHFLVGAQLHEDFVRELLL